MRLPALGPRRGARACGRRGPSPGFASPEELRDAYESRAGQRLPAFGFHLALAFYKLAVIAEGIAYRHRAGATAGEGYDAVAATVPVLLEAGLEVAGRHE